MSRIGKKNILLPDKVSVIIKDHTVTVRGPKGELSRIFPDSINVGLATKHLHITQTIISKKSNQLHGLSRTMLYNMVNGVSSGFTKSLEIQGVGYRSQMEGKSLILNLGYSHPVKIDPPEGIIITVENNVNINIMGIDKELVGEVAANIRSIRSPEPYKGKGVRYSNEYVQRKVGKAGKGK
uniref:Large ribosomal subunit protein uL6c n=1 Tax=Boldia erythrosiphon TaxID=74908 RepID=A0A1Y9TLW1_9RHOD|nr:50S ribosomal protein L6 [Boldia erythrosiphon]ARO90595.1 50S ribosomal protein L6 [Boldia erythrosiphon]